MMSCNNKEYLELHCYLTVTVFISRKLLSSSFIKINLDDYFCNRVNREGVMLLSKT